MLLDGSNDSMMLTECSDSLMPLLAQCMACFGMLKDLPLMGVSQALPKYFVE